MDDACAAVSREHTSTSETEAAALDVASVEACGELAADGCDCVPDAVGVPADECDPGVQAVRAAAAVKAVISSRRRPAATMFMAPI
jgi:hypothetical protein